ncbi:MAG: hypothetical protein ACK4WF_03055 [Candidatus Brocadiales bacterium]
MLKREMAAELRMARSGEYNCRIHLSMSATGGAVVPPCGWGATSASRGGT